MFYLSAGKGKEAAELATQLEPHRIAGLLEPRGPRWQRAAALTVVAAVGRALPVEWIAKFASDVLSEARGEADAWVAPQPALAAKRALAAILLAVPAALRDAAVEQLSADLHHGDFSVARACADALMLGTDAELCDGTDAILDRFADDPYNHGIPVEWVAARLAQWPAKATVLRAPALAGREAVLEALVLADLVDGDDELLRACEAGTRGWLDYAPSEETVADGVVRASAGMGAPAHGAGVLGRCASETTRAALLAHMLEIASSSKHPEGARASAVDAIYNLAPALSSDQARDAAARLETLAQGDYELSRWDSNMAHPLSAFNVTLHQPEVLWAAALEAVSHLAALHEAVAAPSAAIETALRDGGDRAVAAAVAALAELPALEPSVPVEAAMQHPSAPIRAAALQAWIQRRGALPPDELTERLVADPAASVRLALLQAAAADEKADRLVQRLAEDPDAYVRLMARRASRGG
ncbi:MAG: hypothetical protein M3389_03920 [Actinomycetota bacterium]|nr:hypothetical protein [Actinomycetota bacterium]